ncbi:rCG23324 [Rattus norvegicus]|uniref:RCG23324 n=1 Tax=Rattus norvegicus TaxID=10116 RepID=A6JPX0_RAT|nr:rCG23324 [Rattus norvegicus]
MLTFIVTRIRNNEEFNVTGHKVPGKRDLIIDYQCKL